MPQTQNRVNPEFSIHPATRIGSVSLTVSNLRKQAAFYQDVLGFQLQSQEGNQAILGTGDHELLHLVEQPAARRYNRVTGLYHFAILFPNQRELARAIARLSNHDYRNFPTDHILTKTTYLDDPEGNGIELYAESPEDGAWFMDADGYYARRVDGSLSNGREPLDLNALFNHLKEDDRLDIPIPVETQIGHVHLHVSDIEQAVNFYQRILGFDVMGSASSMQIAFVSAGGYHHHIGLNTWQGEGAPPPPVDAIGLRNFSIEFPDIAAQDQVMNRIVGAGLQLKHTAEGLLISDPSQNGVLLTVRNHK
jgi:catechol 2,3-dioxygenase